MRKKDHTIGPLHSRGRITLNMNVRDAEDLAMMLPEKDGFTRDLWRAIMEAEEYLGIEEDE